MELKHNYDPISIEVPDAWFKNWCYFDVTDTEFLDLVWWNIKWWLLTLIFFAQLKYNRIYKIWVFPEEDKKNSNPFHFYHPVFNFVSYLIYLYILLHLRLLSSFHFSPQFLLYFDKCVFNSSADIYCFLFFVLVFI